MPVPLFSAVQSNQLFSVAPTFIIINSYSHNINKAYLKVEFDLDFHVNNLNMA